ncbi:MAG: hypothetical protein U0793_08490 [Gemmataceae bacterium]
MIVTLPRVEVRSSPDEEYQATSVLKQGDRVVVLRQSKDQPGWLAIQPPPGSFSWINAKNVKLANPRTAVVESEAGEAPVLPGSSVVNKAPNVESVKIKNGSIAIVVDRPFSADGNTWLPIQPPPTEVRFIPAEALRPLGAGTPFAPATGSPLLTQADAAFNAGQFDKARTLYKELADKGTDARERSYAYSRLASLEKGPATTPGNPFLMASGTPGPAPVTPASGRSISYPPQWSTWGTLRQAPFERDGLPVYILESKDRRVQLYVTTQTGMSLRDYVGRMVCVYGAITYRTDDPRATHFLVASHVATP